MYFNIGFILHKIFLRYRGWQWSIKLQDCILKQHFERNYNCIFIGVVEKSRRPSFIQRHRFLTMRRSQFPDH